MALVTELVMFAAGAWLYTRATRATGAWGRYGWPALGGVLALGFVGGTLGTPPAAIEPLLVTMGLTMVLVVGVAIAVDRQRPSRQPDPA